MVSNAIIGNPYYVKHIFLRITSRNITKHFSPFVFPNFQTTTKSTTFSVFVYCLKVPLLEVRYFNSPLGVLFPRQLWWLRIKQVLNKHETFTTVVIVSLAHIRCSTIVPKYYAVNPHDHSGVKSILEN